MISLPPGPRTIRNARTQLSGRLSDWGYATGWRMVRAMPELVARGTFDAGAFYASLGGGPEQLRKNLARVIDVSPARVPDSLMRASLASYARYWREAFRLPSMDKTKLAERLDVITEGQQYIEAALEKGRGAVCVLPHSGNWDVAGVWLVYKHGTFTTVAERLKPESLYRRFIDYRESLGFEVIPLTGGQRPPYELLLDRLRANRFVCLMADRDLTRTGVEVEFFGEPTRMPVGPARLAIESGAALIPFHCWFEKDDWGMKFQTPLDTSSGDVSKITQEMANCFAEGIAAHPEDWHMLQPQWLADLSDERRARLQAESS